MTFAARQNFPECKKNIHKNVFFKLNSAGHIRLYWFNFFISRYLAVLRALKRPVRHANCYYIVCQLIVMSFWAVKKQQNYAEPGLHSVFWKHPGGRSLPKRCCYLISVAVNFLNSQDVARLSFVKDTAKDSEVMKIAGISVAPRDAYPQMLAMKLIISVKLRGVFVVLTDGR